MARLNRRRVSGEVYNRKIEAEKLVKEGKFAELIREALDSINARQWQYLNDAKTKTCISKALNARAYHQIHDHRLAKQTLKELNQIAEN